MALSNDIVLRPRFKIKIGRYNQSILSDFRNAKTTQSDFIVTRVDDHVFIKFPRDKQTFWSPQLHLEINKVDDNNSIIHGLFGPNPTVWTMFIFLHFMIITVFVILGIWAYSEWSLEQNIALQVSLMVLMVVIWIALYFAGSIGKASSKQEMHALNDFMYKVLGEKKAS
ncbi:GTP-binding protein [Tamlana sp. 2201CG12-4]|uniref:GTP-binding protein n=1 Tax=Tamlana sp. 2201CG12-4 TaxID=3112582 RepID=UPI002DB8236B|nr:GTP-binding protein [Tamlana sp. 2201CG12-4]MEC3905422.1 GTP-binding protein [Tamlana sp. 2201CG12-4]